MPVVLGETEQRSWVDPALDEAGALDLLGRKRKDFSVYRVSPHVNKPANDDARCIAPL